MYGQIESEYKWKCNDLSFTLLYYGCSFGITAFFFVLLLCFPKYGTVITIAMAFFIFCFVTFILNKDMKKDLSQQEMQEKFLKRVELYKQKGKEKRMLSFVTILTKYNLKTKANLKLIIDHYNSKNPIRIKSGFWGWVVSVFITLASFMEIAYNKETIAIDYDKLEIIFVSTLAIIILFIGFYLLIHFIYGQVITSQEKLHNFIISDLTEVYINYDKYKYQLNKKRDH